MKIYFINVIKKNLKYEITYLHKKPSCLEIEEIKPSLNIVEKTICLEITYQIFNEPQFYLYTISFDVISRKKFTHHIFLRPT